MMISIMVFMLLELKVLLLEFFRKNDFLTNFLLQADTIHRLAAAHRATVRALQDFIQQLPDAGFHGDVSRISKELSSLIQQLSECCSQLEIGGDSGGLQDSVAKLLHNDPVSLRDLFYS